MRTVEYTGRLHANSTAFDDAFYDEDAQEVYVRFHNGRVAGYKGVQSSTWQAWQQAQSAGSFYANFIKDKFIGVDGNVNFVPYEFKQEKTAERHEFLLLVTLTQTIKVSATGLDDAVQQVQAAAKREGAEVVVKEAKVVFE